MAHAERSAIEIDKYNTIMFILLLMYKLVIINYNVY